ncbi:MAG: GNAT family N-acetyltransferase [Dehalococcoidia bacterium]
MTQPLPAVRYATVEDLDALGAVLGAAFDDDPVLNWLVRQDERRSEAIAALFREVTRHAYIQFGETYLLEDGSGAAVWRPPGVTEPETPALEAEWPEIVGPRGFDHLRASGPVMARHHPAETHAYLFALGVDPEAQRGGRGSALIRHVLDRCDREGMPAYLENTKERNLPFYEGHGFRTRATESLPDGGPPMWFMWRAPGASRS